MPRGRIDVAPLFMEDDGIVDAMIEKVAAIPKETFMTEASKRAIAAFHEAKDWLRGLERCTVCRQRQDWFQLDGSGRCVRCQP